MNIFIIGLPKSGKTTVAKILEQTLGFKYLNISDWIKTQFRNQHPNEHEQHFKEEFSNYFFNLFKDEPSMCADYAIDAMAEYGLEHQYVIDGIMSPRDFSQLFDAEKDIVVILNRTDNDEFLQDHENIGLSTIRDYCFWTSAIGALAKSRWIEYNFKMFGEDSDYVKILGAKNSVYLVKSMNNVLSHLQNKVKELTHS